MRVHALVLVVATVIALGCGDDASTAVPDGGAPSGTGGSAGLDGSTLGGGGGSGGVANDAAVPDSAMPTITPGGGTIRDGVCHPPTAPTREELGAEVEVLVKKPGDLSLPLPHATGVYYSNRGDGLYRIAGAGTTPELLLATPDQGQSYSRLLISGEYLYYAISDAYSAGPSLLERLPLSDFGATPEFVLDDARVGHAVDTTHVYAIDPATGDLYREPIGGGGAEPLVAGLGATYLHLGSDGFLYYGWTSGDPSVWRIPTAGGTPESIIDVAGGNFRALKAATGGVVWSASMYGLFFTPFGQPGTARRLHPDRGLDLLAVDGDRVYWVTNDLSEPTVGWTSLDGSDCGIGSDAGTEFGRAVVGIDALYITTRGTTDPPDHLYRIPLP